MKDSEDQGKPRKGNTPGRGEPGKARRSGTPARGAKRPRPSETKPIPGTLPRDGSPKRTPSERKPRPRPTAADGTPKRTSRSTSTTASRQGTSWTSARGTAGRATQQPAKGAPSRRPSGRKQSPIGKSSATATRKPRPKPLSAEEQAAKEKKKRLIIGAIIAVLVVALAIGAAVFLQSQLNKREEQIVAGSEEDNFDVIPCDPSMLEMDINRFGSVAGYPITFAVSMTNTSEQTCSLDAGSDHLVLEVTSGNDNVWASNHCVSGDESELYVFSPGVSTQIDVQWGGNRSNAECTGGLPAPRPGTYVVQGSVDGTEFPQLRQSFVLTDSSGAAPAEEPTEEETTEEPVEETTNEDAAVDEENDPTEEFIVDEDIPEDHEHIQD
ncbi:MAG: hypothetical protein ACTHWJ_07955 [Flaviflexus sp.]|uniref:hypothetical protein n=1 Tax=Flaviflexus sp. TaxID=1969482 RepID=UPI003F916ED1